MSESLWNSVDEYLHTTLSGGDEVLTAALESSRDAGLPEIAVSPPLGRLLMLLAQSVGARRILEVGTLGGYSTIWLARALSEHGRLISLECEKAHAEVARANLERAGLSDRAGVRIGAALEILPQLPAEGPFDFTFIDADKENNAAYFDWAVKLSRPGSLIVVDNVVREGRVLTGEDGDGTVAGTRQVLEMVGKDPRVEATAIQTVGSKGYDGFLLARVRGVVGSPPEPGS